MRLPVQLNRGSIIAFENDIDFRVVLVEMFAGIAADLRQVDGSGKLLPLSKGSSSYTARTIHCW